MKPNIDDAIEIYQNEYSALQKEGEEPAAFERLAYIHNVVENNEWPNKKKYQLKEFVETALLEFRSFERVKVRLIENTERVTKILSIGSEFNDDEMLLVLTLLMEVELGLRLLNHSNNYLVIPQFELANADLESMAASTTNKKNLNSAKEMIKTNCLLPLASRYL